MGAFFNVDLNKLIFRENRRLTRLFSLDFFNIIAIVFMTI